jgi:hypothetical protein
VPFCPPCIAAGARRQEPEGSDGDSRSGPNWQAVGLVLGILGVLAFLIFESARHDIAAEAGSPTNTLSQTNLPSAPNPSTP